MEPTVSRRARARLALPASLGLVPALLVLLAAQEARPAEDPLPPRDPAVTAAALEQHVRFLASDEMLGRDTGSPQTVRAAHYIAKSLERSGVAPAGDDGTFLQKIALVRMDTDKDTIPTILVEGTDGKKWEAHNGRDFKMFVRGLPDESRRLRVERIADADGAKTVAGEKDRHGLAVFADVPRTEVWKLLEGAGLGQGEGLGLVLQVGTTREGRDRPLRGGRLQLRPTGPDPADIVQAGGKLLTALQAGKVAAMTLDSHATVSQRSDQNVVGILRGVGKEDHPELADQAVVISAHYDHVGVLPAHDKIVSGEVQLDHPIDTIFNGADDDASGVAAVLEIAEALGAGPPPARTVVFLLATGEERGLLGTDAYLEHPAVPLAKTYFDLNIEMIGRPDPLLPDPGDVWLTGWDQTTLGPSVSDLGIPLRPDPHPEQNFYQRSDNIAFVKRGVMGQTVSSYGLHKDYHRVTDEPDTLDYPHMEQATKTTLAVARALCVDGIAIAPAEDLGGK